MHTWLFFFFFFPCFLPTLALASAFFRHCSNSVDEPTTTTVVKVSSL